MAIVRLHARAVIACAAIVTALCGCGSGDAESGGAENRAQSIARYWIEEALAAIRVDTPRPPVHARNLFHLSVAMYDAWAAYDPDARGYLLHEKALVEGGRIADARREAISYAGYRLLRNRYALSVNATTTLQRLDEAMKRAGYDIGNADTSGGAPASIGNRSAAVVIAFGDADGSSQAANYRDPTYTPINDPLIVAFPGNSMADPNAWQPLALDVAFTQNGLPEPNTVQSFVCSQWDEVRPFALTRRSSGDPYVPAGSPPLLGGPSDAAFKAEMLDLIRKSAALSADRMEHIDLSPSSLGNNSLGANDGSGHPINPVTGEPYERNVVLLGDFARVLAEFWADGPSSETPPGHWNVIANQVSDSAFQTYQFEGAGQPLDRLEWDVKLYFALNGALHDAAVNCWGVKRRFDSVRPISAIRYMGSRGQSTDPALPSFHSQGLPLEAGLVELITEETWPAGRHSGIRCCVSLSGVPAPCTDSAGGSGTEISCVGEIAVLSWPGAPADRKNDASGSRWIRAEEWVPYQLPTFVSPAFPGFNSGHSTFSRAAAEVLTAFTGSAFFPGGLAEFVAERSSFLTFERGPSSDVRLQWATYYDAADQAGLSRLFGGIHIASDDFSGRRSGSEIGKAAFAKARSYFTGTGG